MFAPEYCLGTVRLRQIKPTNFPARPERGKTVVTLLKKPLLCCYGMYLTVRPDVNQEYFGRLSEHSVVVPGQGEG